MDKNTTLEHAREHVAKTIVGVSHKKQEMQKSLDEGEEKLKSASAIEKVSEIALLDILEKRVMEMGHLEDSPYFVRLDVIWEGESEVSTLYFGKFSFDESDVYSWVAPASSMRFESMGPVSYLTPEGKTRKAELVRKDNYMIVDQKITFLATESTGSPRELVYQEHFSNRRDGFVLPEVVAQMEKAQDKVIRASHKGSFVITGPAGSGKTTLAFHRVAYLAGSPDTSDLYNPKSMIILVQDVGAREYFSHLLPELGVEGVQITTFAEWAMSTLDIKATYTDLHIGNEGENDLYLYAKIRALQVGGTRNFDKRNPYKALRDVYSSFFDENQEKLFASQQKEKVLDHIDLTMLMQSYREKEGEIGQVVEFWDERASGKFYKKKEYRTYKYSLILVDEFQNYLPEQIALLRSCIDPRTQAMLYIGDMAQQIHLGTIKSWSAVGEELHEERQVAMQKVYRNTKKILAYIKQLGYEVSIPEDLREGSAVEEVIFTSQEEELQYISDAISENDDVSIGIIARDRSYLDCFHEKFSDDDRIHIVTMRESQGLEFERVFIVGINQDIIQTQYGDGVAQDLLREKEMIDRDVLYVALTRAMHHLHVSGRVMLSDL